MITPHKTVTDHRMDVVPGVAHLALEVSERTQLTALAIVQDVRGELRVTVDGTLDLAEKALGSLIRVARKLTQRIDEATAETIGSAERLIGTTTRHARETTRAATDLASTALDGIAGPRAASA